MTVALTFATAGTYAYKCKIHPTMTATVEVAS
jgi:plastocyanin